MLGGQKEMEKLVAEHRSFSEQVISEYDLCVLLGISARTLDSLRLTAGLPTIYLNRTNRVYGVSEVLNWLKGRMKT